MIFVDMGVYDRMRIHELGGFGVLETGKQQAGSAVLGHKMALKCEL